MPGGLALTYPCLLTGVTAIRPEDLEFPNTMTDIDYDTWMLRWGCLLWDQPGDGGQGGGGLGGAGWDEGSRVSGRLL